MRAFSCSLAALALLAASAAAAGAQETASPLPGVSAEPPAPLARDVPSPAATQAERLDALFAELRREGDGAKAEAIAARIQREWQDSGSATVDLLMGRAAQAIARKNGAAALDLLDQTVVLDPDYAEGWNRRATLHYAENRYRLSLADVAEVLKREPRHFGALAGMGAMLEEMGRRREALATFERVLAIYPAMKPAQDAAARLADALAGERA